MPDPLDVLHLPIVPLEPRSEFTDGLLRRMRAELRPQLINVHTTEETTMTDTTTTPPLESLVTLLDEVRVVEVVDWPEPEVPAALVRAGLTVVAHRYPPPPPDEPQFVLHQVRPGLPSDDDRFPLDGGGYLAFQTIDERPPVVDLVSTFRPAEEQPGIVALALTLGARAVWVEPGESVSPQAREMAEAARLRWIDGVSIRTAATALSRRQATTSAVTVGLSYVDAPAAIDWLVGVLGFRVLERHDQPDGTVAHAQLAWSTGLVFVSTRTTSGHWATTGPVSMALNQPDPASVDTLYRGAREVGADIVADLHDAFYGSHQFVVRDPEGNLWTVGTYLPAVPVP